MFVGWRVNHLSATHFGIRQGLRHPGFRSTQRGHEAVHRVLEFGVVTQSTPRSGYLDPFFLGTRKWDMTQVEMGTLPPYGI